MPAGGAGRPRAAELALAIAADQGFSFWQAGGTILRGWAAAEGGDRAEGIALLRQGLDAWQATGSVTYRTYFLALLAEVLVQDGQAADGLALLNEALELVEQTGERLFEAELHRLRGEVLRKANNPEAEAAFQRARDVARRQSARSLELRAARSLARLYRDTRRTAKGRSLLADTLARFTEGFDTPDLREAQCFWPNSDGRTRFISARLPLSCSRLPSEMQWLKSFQVQAPSADIAFHFGKAANSRVRLSPLVHFHNSPKLPTARVGRRSGGPGQFPGPPVA